VTAGVKVFRVDAFPGGANSPVIKRSEVIAAAISAGR
jgi:hypothetical protein